jgi:uncharacterized lipoprotein YddW (UPF0748 family)
VQRSALLAGQPAGFDPLSRLLERARARGLEVHGWVNVLLSAGFNGSPPKGHVVAQHPDWVMVPRAAAAAALRPGAPLLALVRDAARGDADVEGYYLSPAVPGVAQHLAAVVGELVRAYPLDGLHFDFIRYPGREFDYSRSALTSFGSSTRSREPLKLASTSVEAYASHRREVLTALAARLAAASRAERPSLRLSAAVVPDEATALNIKYQDWPRWVSEGILDAVCPMTYSPDARIFREQLLRARTLVGARPLWAGVGAYRLGMDELIERVALARASGADGVVLFSHESLQNADRGRLRAEAFGAATARARASGAASPR